MFLVKIAQMSNKVLLVGVKFYLKFMIMIWVLTSISLTNFSTYPFPIKLLDISASKYFKIIQLRFLIVSRDIFISTIRNDSIISLLSNKILLLKIISEEYFSAFSIKNLKSRKREEERKAQQNTFPSILRFSYYQTY